MSLKNKFRMGVKMNAKMKMDMKRDMKKRFFLLSHIKHQTPVW